MVLADEVLLGWVSRDTQQDQTGTGLTIFRNWRRDMTINPNFPLSLQDQADVIEIFNELMRQSENSANSNETSENGPAASPHDLPDHELE